VPNTPRFEPITDWEKDVPPRGMISGLAFDSDDKLYACTRKKGDVEAAVFVYAPSGKFLRSWGEGLFVQPHGITVTPDGYVYVVEDYGSAVRKFTLDGVHVETVGPSGEENRSDTGADLTIKSLYDRLQTIRRDGAGPFNHPTSLAVAPNGDRYIADGYGNCKVHCFSPAGELKRSWGRAGAGPGEFHLVHAVLVASDSKVYVCDRENDRIQIFSPEGAFLGEWADVQRPNSVACDKEGNFYIGESIIRPGHRTFVCGLAVATMPPNITIKDSDGSSIGEFGRGMTLTHSMALDSQGNVFVAGEPIADGIGLIKHVRI